jgi:hypothetical protein
MICVARRCTSKKLLQRSGISVSLIDNLPHDAVVAWPLKHSVGGFSESSRMHLAIIKTTLIVSLLQCTFPISFSAQEEKEAWRRVYTGEDSVIDINVASLVFETGHILRVGIRTVLSKTESLRGQPETKYKSRLETVEFKLPTSQYRYLETSLLDSAGKTVWSDEPNPAQDWRALKEGGMMKRLSDAARQLPPFGSWKVIDYCFADGPSDDSQEFRRFIGTRVRIAPDRMEVGTKICSLPAYQSKSFSDKEFDREVGISMLTLGIKENHAETLVVRCESNDWKPPQSLLVKLPEGRLLMLWQGVFLVLKKERY